MQIECSKHKWMKTEKKVDPRVVWIDIMSVY